MEETTKVSISAYNIIPNKFGFGNRTEIITIYAFEIRCEPSDTKNHIEFFDPILLRSTLKISFMPTGMVQLSGQKNIQKNSGRTQ